VPLTVSAVSSVSAYLICKSYIPDSGGQPSCSRMVLQEEDAG
jgi:hypothetical protein